MKPLRCLLLIATLSLAHACAHRLGHEGQILRELKDVVDLNESLQLGQHQGRWYFVPLDVHTGAPLLEMAQEAFLTDRGPDYFSEGLVRIVRDGRLGFIDEKGRVVVPPEYDFASAFDKGHSVVCRGCVRRLEGEMAMYEGGHWGVIDRTGKVAVPLEFDAIEYDPARLRAVGEKGAKKANFRPRP